MPGSNQGNPVGYVCILDGGNPRIIGGKAQVLTSGGVLVYASGNTDTVSSGTSSYVTSDVGFAIDASGLLFNGISLDDTASGATISVATKGVFVLPANGTVSAGYPVKCDGYNAVVNTAVSADAACKIGRALTSTTSGTAHYCLVDIGAA